MSMNLAYELATAKDDETKEILEQHDPAADPVIESRRHRHRRGLVSQNARHKIRRHVAARALSSLRRARRQPRLVHAESCGRRRRSQNSSGRNGFRRSFTTFISRDRTRRALSFRRFSIRRIRGSRRRYCARSGSIGYKMAADLQAQEHRGRGDKYDLRYVVARRFSLGAVFSQFDRNFVRSRERESDVAGHGHERETATKSRRARVSQSRSKPRPIIPDAWQGGLWRPADIAEIEMIASRALLQMAAKFRPRYLRNFYELGKRES